MVWRNLLIGQPQGSLSERINSHGFNLKFTLSSGVWLGTGFCRGWVKGMRAAVFWRCG